jgi:glycosidase
VRTAQFQAFVVAASLALLACTATPPGFLEDDRCMLRVWYRPEQTLRRRDLTLTRQQAERPQLIGSWDQFRRPGLTDFAIRTASDGTPWFTIALPLPPGRYLYGLLVGDYLLPDERQAQSAFAADPRYLDSSPYEVEYSLAELPSCSAPTLELFESLSSSPQPGAAPASGELRLTALFRPHAADGELDPAAVTVSLAQAALPLPAPSWELLPSTSDGEQRLRVTAGRLAAGKYSVTISVRGRDGQAPRPLTTSVFIEPLAGPATPSGLAPVRPLDDAVVYQVVLDRFRGSAGPLSPPLSPGRRAGGTLDGLRQAIAAGYFERLGVTTLWLSPLYQNPPGLFSGLDGHAYEAYHGYWPSQPRTVEPQLGGESALDTVVAAAHGHGLRVIFDAVPNHVFQSHPYYRQHSRLVPAIAQAADAARQSWFNDGAHTCVCGTPGCGWGERVEDCWFDSYLPDLNWRHPAVMQSGTDDLLWWLRRFDLDGMRIDAVPMMPRAATRRIVQATHQAASRQGLDLLLIGEDYTGPGDAGRVDIRSFLGSSFAGLDSAFDFPLMWATRSTIAEESSGFDSLEREIAHSSAAWAGSGAVMGHILNNHDTPRFVSAAAGNAGNDPWRDPPPQPANSDEQPYRKQLLGLTLLLTLPGLPVLYYGDEVGLAGANDPDSRRPLPDVLATSAPGGGRSLLPIQAEVLATTQRLGQLRACLPALRRGTRTALATGSDYTVALHKDRDGSGSSPVLVVLSRARSDQRLFVPGLVAGSYRDALDPTAPPLTIAGDPAPLLVRGLRPAIYVPAGVDLASCLPAAGSFAATAAGSPRPLR